MAACSTKPGVLPVVLPEMTKVSDRLSITAGGVRVSLFNQVLPGYIATGPHKEDFQEIITDPKKEGDVLTCASFIDARKLAQELSKNTNKNFQVPTEDEWLQAQSGCVERAKISGRDFGEVKHLFVDEAAETLIFKPDILDRKNAIEGISFISPGTKELLQQSIIELSGDFWVWTETIAQRDFNEYSNAHVLRHPKLDYRNYNEEIAGHYHHISVCLVEVLNALK